MNDLMISLIATLPVLYLGICSFVYFYQSRLIYRPSREVRDSPASRGLVHENVGVTTEDGVRLAGWRLPHPDPKGTVLFFHGNAGNVAHRLKEACDWHGLGYHVFVFDYRGFGRSEGRPSEEGLYRDARAAWRHLIEDRREDPKRIILAGRSLGGAVAIDLARRHPPGALVVESTFTSLPEVARRKYPWLPVRRLCRHRFASIDKVPHIPCLKIFLHGREDRLIPPAMGRRLFEAAAAPKHFIETPGGHGDAGMFYAPEFTRRVTSLLDEAAPVESRA